jgi:hypothetical protein
MKKSRTNSTSLPAQRPLRVWAERRRDPDWDRFIAALVALAMRRVEEADAEEDRG